MDLGPPGSSVHGILQARILQWVACPPPGDLLNPGIESPSPALQVDSLPLSHQGSPNKQVDKTKEKKKSEAIKGSSTRISHKRLWQDLVLIRTPEENINNLIGSF